MSDSANVSKKYASAPEPPADLFLAATFDDVPLMEKALAQGKSINTVHPDTGKTPAHVASSWGSLQFIERAAQIPEFDPLIFDNNGHTAYSYAALRKDREIKQILSTLMDRAQPLPDLSGL